MALAVLINPMHMDYIIEMVLDHIEPPLLLPCLAVNKTWNRFGGARMKKAGWRTHVTSERLEEYLRLLEATERERGGAVAGPAVIYNQDGHGRGRMRMDLCLHLQVYPGPDGSLELETAMKIQQNPEAPKIVYLELDYVTSNSNFIAAPVYFFRTMEICSSVTKVNTNLSTWTELAGKFMELEGRDGWTLWTRRRPHARSGGVILLPPMFQRVLPSVTTLKVATPKSQVPPDPDGRQMHTVCFLIRHLFPNLTHLVIDLGLEMDSDSTYAMNAELDYVLRLGFGVPRLRHMEIQNFYHKWLTPRRGNEGNGGTPVLAGNTSAWETLKICGIPKSYQTRTSDRSRPRFSHDGLRTHELDLDALLSVLPVHCPSLLLKIDGQLLLNPSKSDSVAYEQIVADLLARTTHPRIQLI